MPLRFLHEKNVEFQEIIWLFEEPEYIFHLAIVFVSDNQAARKNPQTMPTQDKEDSLLRSHFLVFLTNKCTLDLYA